MAWASIHRIGQLGHRIIATSRDDQTAGQIKARAGMVVSQLL